MIILSSNKTQKHRIEILSCILLILLYLFRTSLPILKFPFLVLYIGFIAYTIITYRNLIIYGLKKFFQDYYLPIILGFILLLAFLFSNKLYLIIFKDVLNSFILLSLFFISSLVISGEKDFKTYTNNIIRFIIVFAFIISVLQLASLFEIFSYNSLFEVEKIDLNSPGDTLYIDPNFILIPVFFGIIGILYLLPVTKSKLLVICYKLFLAVFSLNIILSGSRRGIILLAALFVFLLVARFVSLFHKGKYTGIFEIHSGFFLITLVTITMLLRVFVFNTSYTFKNKSLEFIGSKNILIAKYKIYYNLFRYGPAINGNKSFSDIFWTNALDPKDPDSGWGTRVHKTIFPLTGNNVDIVPKGVKGYLMDHTCSADYSLIGDISEAHTFLVNLNVSKGDRYKASVYCFVSDSFNVDAAYFGVGAASINKSIVSGNFKALYNMGRKEVWQKLEIDFDCNDGMVPIYLSFWKKGVKDFSKLKGHIIFAYPKYEKTDKMNKGLSINITQIQNNKKELENNDLICYEKDRLENALKNSPENHTYENESKLILVNLNAISVSFSCTKLTHNQQKKYYAGFFPLSLVILSEPDSNITDRDPIRRIASKFISEDTTYYPYKSKISLFSISNQLIDSRFIRWQYAIQVFSKEYTIKEKLFGGGFDFLNWYGNYFLKDKTKSDWPHNPFLSVLLYSGIIGLLIYIFFMFKGFYYYLKYIKDYPLLFIFFIITFFFSFFSGSSPFDPPIMGFFSILPFFIHAVHKKDRSEAGSLESELVIKQ